MAVAVWAIDRANYKREQSNPPELVWPNHSAATCPSIRQIMKSDDRQKLNGAVLSGDIIAWGRTRGFPDPRPIRPTFWGNCALAFTDVDGDPMSYMDDGRTFRWRKANIDPTEATYYDIHFNTAQLRRIFPDASF